MIQRLLNIRLKNNMRRLVEKDYKVVANLTSKPEIQNFKGYDIIVVRTDHGKFSNFVNAVDEEFKKFVLSLKDGDLVDIEYEYDKKYGFFRNFYDIKKHRLSFYDRMAYKHRFWVNCKWDGVSFTSEDEKRKSILAYVVKKNYFAINDYFRPGKEILDKFEYPGIPCSGKLFVERYIDSDCRSSWEILLPVEFKADASRNNKSNGIED